VFHDQADHGIQGGRIAEVEFSADLRRANPAHVWNLPARTLESV
jgi:hypothetical protein